MIKNEQTRFGVADIIGTDLDDPHMVLEIVQNENETGRRHGEYGYRLLDLNTGKHAVAHAGGIDLECVPYDELTSDKPRAFDGALILRGGELRMQVQHTKVFLDKNLKIEVGGGEGAHNPDTVVSIKSYAPRPSSRRRGDTNS